MSFFSGRSVDDIPDNPNELPNNTYKFQVIGAKLAHTQNKTGQSGFVPKLGITFKYQIVEGAWSNFFPITDWCQVPDENTPEDKQERMLSYLKMRLLAFGFTPDEIQEFGPGDVEKTINRVFYGTTSMKKEKGNTQIRVQKFDPIDNGVDTMIDFGDSPGI
jgi:hypothetical protein